MKELGKRKGFTLLELIVVLSVLSIGVFIISPNINVYSDKKAKIEMDYTVDGVIELINEGKACARLMEKPVLVTINGRLIIFTVDTKIFGSFQLPPSIKSVTFVGGGYLTINSLGNVGAKSILVQSESNQLNAETITVKVGTSYVSRKN